MNRAPVDRELPRAVAVDVQAGLAERERGYQRGEAIFHEVGCASCHGANLEGQPNWKERRADGKLPAHVRAALSRTAAPKRA